MSNLTATELAKRLRAVCGDPSCIMPMSLEIQDAADMLIAQEAELLRLRAVEVAAKKTIDAWNDWMAQSADVVVDLSFTLLGGAP